MFNFQWVQLFMRKEEFCDKIWIRGLKIQDFDKNNLQTTIYRSTSSTNDPKWWMCINANAEKNLTCAGCWKKI